MVNPRDPNYNRYDPDGIKEGQDPVQQDNFNNRDNNGYQSNRNRDYTRRDDRGDDRRNDRDYNRRDDKNSGRDLIVQDVKKKRDEEQAKRSDKGRIDYNLPLNFNQLRLDEMTPEQLKKWQLDQKAEFKNQITVPVSNEDISKILDQHRENNLNDNFDDKLSSMNAQLKGINASYKLGESNTTYKTTNVEKKALELFKTDLHTPQEYFVKDMITNFKAISEFSLSLFTKPSIDNWKYAILSLVILVSYVLNGNYNIQFLKGIIPNIFLIGCIIYSIFTFTGGSSLFLGNIEGGGILKYTSLITFIILLLLLALSDSVSILQSITAPFNTNVISGFVSLILFVIIVGNIIYLYFTKELIFYMFVLWFMISLFYVIDALQSIDTISIGHIVWSVIFPGLLLLLNKNNIISMITSGVFMGIYVNELMKNNIKYILF